MPTSTAAAPAPTASTAVPPIFETDEKYGPTILLRAKATDRFGMKFGPTKARLILANLDAIRQFAADHPEK